MNCDCCDFNVGNPVHFSTMVNEVFWCLLVSIELRNEGFGFRIVWYVLVFCLCVSCKTMYLCNVNSYIFVLCKCIYTWVMQAYIDLCCENLYILGSLKTYIHLCCKYLYIHGSCEFRCILCHVNLRALHFWQLASMKMNTILMYFFSQLCLLTSLLQTQV
jgi:hypothetical protein